MKHFYCLKLQFTEPAVVVMCLCMHFVNFMFCLYSDYYGDCFTALDKIREQYDVLANSPVNKLLPSLYAKRVITLDDKKIMEAKPLEKDRMNYLLDDVLIRSLNIGYGSKYNGFLKVLEESDDDVLDDLTRTLGEFNTCKAK